MPAISKKVAFLVGGTCYASAVLLGVCNRPSLNWIPNRSVLTESKYYMTSSEIKLKINILATSMAEFARSFRAER